MKSDKKEKKKAVSLFRRKGKVGIRKKYTYCITKKQKFLKFLVNTTIKRPKKKV